MMALFTTNSFTIMRARPFLPSFSLSARRAADARAEVDREQGGPRAALAIAQVNAKDGANHEGQPGIFTSKCAH